MRSASCDPAPAHSAPCDHVRGDLVAPVIDWLGELLVERRRPVASLDALLTGRERELLFATPTDAHWVPLAAGRRLVEAVVDVHGGRMPAVLRELGRRSAPRIAALQGVPVERMALRLDQLIRLGHWRRPRLGLPGDLIELEARRACAPSLVGWIGGLLAAATPAGLRGATRVAARIEAPRRVVFVRCAG